MPIDMKTVITTTFVAMVKQKGIDKITVKSLIDACNISRQTFYYHFRDIMEVIEWSLEQATQDMLSRSLKAENPVEALSILISSAVENRTLIFKLLNSQRREQIEQLFVQAARTYLQELIRNRPHQVALDYADTEVALDFWAYGITGTLFQYCQRDQMDVKSLAEQIYRLLPEKSEQGNK